jgi:hypothetical protein
MNTAAPASRTLPRADTVGGRLRSAVLAPVRVASPEVHAVLRYLVVMLVCTGALGALVWTRMAMRRTALELDAARSALARAETQRERLLVERTLLREPGRLQAEADALGLVPPEKIVTVEANP